MTNLTGLLAYSLVMRNATTYNARRVVLPPAGPEPEKEKPKRGRPRKTEDELLESEREANRKEKKRQYDRRLAEGKCGKCGADKEDRKKSLCPGCVKRNKERRVNARNLRLSGGKQPQGSSPGAEAGCGPSPCGGLQDNC